MGRDVKSEVVPILLVQVTVASVVVWSLRRQKNKQTEVGETMRSSSKQNKNMKLLDVLEVKSLGLYTNIT